MPGRRCSSTAVPVASRPVRPLRRHYLFQGARAALATRDSDARGRLKTGSKDAMVAADSAPDDDDRHPGRV
ncbi:hypothetical protein MRX96_035081 [Rhipicephalus microplus]